MPSQILVTMDDLETAVPLNAALEAAGFSTAMLSSLDDARGAVPRENPDLVVLTGAVHDPHAVQLAALARDAEISTLALLEPTDSERAERVGRLGVTETMMKPARPDEIVETARRLIDRRGLQERTGIIGESNNTTPPPATVTEQGVTRREGQR
jgi:DNA-binding response OmpR family regulator